MPSGAGKRYYALGGLLLLILAIRYVPGAGEWYATCLYPWLSYLLSALSSLVSFSLEEWIVVMGGLLLVIMPLVGIWKKRGVGTILLREVEVVAWIVIWFYLGWGCNYFRLSFYYRYGIEPVQTEKEVFVEFLHSYTDSLNAAYVGSLELDKTWTEQQIKRTYTKMPGRYGLCRPQSFQHPKQVSFNRLYSGVGVLGYMGPFMAESQLNEQLSPVQYPFTYAHELAHLLGVSNEAEANFWAFDVCTRSEERALRYCGYYGLLPYLLNNSRTLLTPEERQEWITSIDPRIIADLQAQGQFWNEQQIAWINDIQEWIYDWYLKTNSIPAGKANYSQVVQLVMSVYVGEKRK